MRSNFLYTSNKVFFDPTNEEHLKEYAIYLEQGRWTGSCRFQVEFPYIEIPAMINAKLAKHMLSKYMIQKNEFNPVAEG